MSRPPRSCITCGKNAVPGRSRCKEHGPTSPLLGTTTQRGYGSEHQHLAKELLTPDARCAQCGKPGTPDDPLQLDHIIPLSMGGTLTRDNVQPLHRSENIAKGGANRLKGRKTR
jgi:5-methylcytosine-specific restriction endonuclease McrA